MTSPTVIDVTGPGPQPAGAGTASRPPVRTAPRVIGIVLLVLSVGMLVVPTSYGWFEGRGYTGRSVCGVPFQALFNPPGYGCTRAAYTQAAKSAAVAVLGFGVLAFSGIRRRLRFAGLAALALSPFPLLFSTSEFQPVMDGNISRQCGSAIGDLVRRGYTEVTFQGGTGPLSPACGDRALSRLYLTLGIVAFAALLLVVDVLRRRNSQPLVGQIR
jgi:hypothetical protein